MSKVRLQSYFRLLILLAGLQIFTEARAQAVDVEITVDRAERAAKVLGRFRDGFRPLNPRNLAFKREVAGFAGLAERVRDAELKSATGGPVTAKRLMAGEYVSESDFAAWSYSVDLAPAQNRIAAAHASWLGEGRGILMLDDLLPIFSTRDHPISGRITLKLPDGWAAFSVANGNTSMTFNASDITQSVIFIGNGLRNRDVEAATGKLNLILSGEWQFSDDDAAGMAREIFDEYSKMLGKLPVGSYQIGLMKFPGQEAPGAWQAETRGRTVTVISSDMPFKTQSQQRLHEQLRHEIFHLWFPNSVNLNGDYAWFYEGFALYQSLKLGVQLNRIRFDDFLDTLGRAYTIDANARPRRALTDKDIDPTVRYARGMLIALLVDLELLVNSKGKLDVTHKLRSLFERYGSTNKSADANYAITGIIGLYDITENYAFGVEPIMWAENLARIGIESRQNGRATTLSVVAKPTGRQKEILDRLGYNNWRKTDSKR